MKKLKNIGRHGWMIIFGLMFFSIGSFGQGKNYNWLMGHQSKMRMTFTDTSYSITPEVRKIPFMDTHGNISDENGNLLMSSNGYFIADASGDTMQNGSGINPGLCTDDYGPTYGLPMSYANIILPLPGDTAKYVLFHQTCDYSSPFLAPSVIYFTIIDRTLNSGLGAVVSKNNIALTGNFGAGMSACKHGNGRDWWVVALSDSAKKAFMFLVTPDTIEFIGFQNLPIPGCWGFAGQPTFSPDAEKFAFVCGNGNGVGFWTMFMQLFYFDRCSGSLTLDTLIDYSDGNPGFGTAFCPSSKYLYFSTTEHIYQVDTDTSDIGATFHLVAANDTFLSAPPVFYTNFYLMYLAANGKIYLTSTNSVLDLHYINNPDSAGVACDVRLHDLHLPYFVTHTVPNHPNYYLGALTGSPCDTLTSISEVEHDFKIKIFPNPSNGVFKILYLLPQNEKGKLEVFDVNGRRVYEMNLPPWSTMQSISLPSSVGSGVYNCVITSKGERINKKIAVIKE